MVTDIGLVGRSAARGAGSLVGLGPDDLLAAVVAARADVVPPMDFAAHRFDRERRAGEKVVRAVHATLRGRFLVLLDCHHVLLCVVIGSAGGEQVSAGCRGANGSASINSSSTSSSGSRGPAASTTSASMRASSAASSLSDAARSTVPWCRTGHAKLPRQRWHLSVTSPVSSMSSAARPSPSAAPAMRHEISAGPCASTSATRVSRWASMLPSTLPRSRASFHASGRTIDNRYRLAPRSDSGAPTVQGAAINVEFYGPAPRLSKNA